MNLFKVFKAEATKEMHKAFSWDQCIRIGQAMYSKVQILTFFFSSLALVSYEMPQLIIAVDEECLYFQLAL